MPSFHRASVPTRVPPPGAGPRGGASGCRTCTVSEGGRLCRLRAIVVASGPLPSPQSCLGPPPQGGRGPPGQGGAWPRPQGGDAPSRCPLSLEMFTIRASFEANVAPALDCQLPGLPGSPPTPACPASFWRNAPREAEGCVTVIPSIAGEFCLSLKKRSYNNRHPL